MLDPTATRFPHSRLDAYRISLELASAARRMSDAIPHGYRTLADQLLRAGIAVPLLISEGANRVTPGQKRQRFSEARGECGECAAAAEVAAVLGLVSPAEAQTVMVLADRVAAMLTRLVQRLS